MALGDMLGSAKMNGMAGHSAIYGDRFSLVKGARSSTKRGSKAQYYSISPPQNEIYNPSRPAYDLNQIPMRSEKHYWDTIEKLLNASTKAAHTEITKATGISHMSLATASPAFVHPSFFPLDPFHLLFENVMAFIWDLLTTISSSDEKIHIQKEKLEKFGKLITASMTTCYILWLGQRPSSKETKSV